jgi:alpha-galactosidase
MHDALNGTGHPIFFSMCEWGVQDPATWAPAMANSWRTTGDIHRGWDSWTKILDANDKWWHYAGPGGWNDPDMLEVDNGKMTFTEERAHFTMWCLIKAPLLLGMDLRQITDQALDIITNEEVIIWNQDRLGIQGHCVFQQTFVSSSGEEDKIEVWTAPLDRGHHAVVLLNRGTTSREITATWEDLLITSATAMQVRDVWKHQNIGTAVSNFTALVEPHDIVAIQLTPAFDRIH